MCIESKVEVYNHQPVVKLFLDSRHSKRHNRKDTQRRRKTGEKAQTRRKESDGSRFLKRRIRLWRSLSDEFTDALEELKFMEAVGKKDADKLDDTGEIKVGFQCIVDSAEITNKQLNDDLSKYGMDSIMFY